MKYRGYITDSFNPYENLAMEEHLFSYVDEETNLLFLWQNENTIVIGRNQDVTSECKADEFIATGGRIARRRSGGGAVYHDLGNLNFSIIGRKNNMRPMLYRDLLIELVKGMGLQPEYTGRNDILVDGCKFSGNAVYDNGKIVCQHGTIMVDVDIERMSYFLTPNAEKMKRHAIKSVSQRVVNLKEVNENVTVDLVKENMLNLVNAQMLRMDNVMPVSKLRNKYENTDWIYGGVL